MSAGDLPARLRDRAEVLVAASEAVAEIPRDDVVAALRIDAACLREAADAIDELRQVLDDQNCEVAAWEADIARLEAALHRSSAELERSGVAVDIVRDLAADEPIREGVCGVCDWGRKDDEGPGHYADCSFDRARVWVADHPKETK